MLASLRMRVARALHPSPDENFVIHEICTLGWGDRVDVASEDRLDLVFVKVAEVLPRPCAHFRC
jgi:hypothetical protein